MFGRPLQIAYFAVLLDGINSGASTKVLNQIEVWKLAGVKVTLHVICQQKELASWSLIDGVQAYSENSGIRKLLTRVQVMRHIFQSSPDIVYVRDSFPFIFSTARFQGKILLEVQSFLYEELALRSSLRVLFARIIDKIFLRGFHGFVFVTHEISSSKRFSQVTKVKPSCVIANGIDFAKYPKALKLPNSQKRGVFFIGQSGQEWHGLSEIFELARKMPSFEFHLVGFTQHGPERLSNVFFHGVLTVREYAEIAQDCVIGLGTLNLGAKGMTEASPLKVRDCLALGLPVVIRYCDTDFLESKDFLLQLPQDGRPVSDFVPEISEFAESWLNHRVSKEEIAHLDMSRKEDARFQFFRKVIQSDLSLHAGDAG